MAADALAKGRYMSGLLDFLTRAQPRKPDAMKSYSDESLVRDEAPDPDDVPNAKIHLGHILTAEGYIERVYHAFDASQPVAAAGDLFGREQQLKQLVEGVLHRRNHAFVVGQPGAGKTSLIRTFGQNLDAKGIVALYSVCEDGASFGEFMRSYFLQLPASMLASGAAEEFHKQVMQLPDRCTAAQAADLFAQIRYSNLIIISDEFERVTGPDLQQKFAMLMKLVSDARLPVRFLLIGDRKSFNNLARAHPSLMRHISYISVDPLDDEAVAGLLRNAAARCGMRFDDQAVELIVEVVCGSPYHARLFGLHSGLEALSSNKTDIGLAEAVAGIHRAFAEWTVLNPQDAQSLRNIADWNHGDPESHVHFARTTIAIEGENVRGEVPTKQIVPDADQIAEFGSAVMVTNGSARFREPTAPQFLVALAKVMARDVVESKQGHHLDA
jgi:type II secretory pathway predicted ATPase ExeA